jgi:hypothetical protein
MELKYTIKGDHVCVDKITEPEREVMIPERMEGLPVTELGAYVLSGTDVEEVHLPAGVTRIGAYAFYNCENLRRIHCFGRATDLGAGVFTNDRGIEYLELKNFPGERSCFKEMLTEIRQTLRVRVLEGTQEARLIFPEYYEEAVENTPGRKIDVETHGCGQRYRYCFVRREFQYAGYDELFPHVKVQESEELVCELAIGRLKYPMNLTQRYQEKYREYLKEHWLAAAKVLIAADRPSEKHSTNLDSGELPWLLEEIVTVDAEQMQQIIDAAQKTGDTEMVSWLMNYNHIHFAAETPKRKRRFEL